MAAIWRAGCIIRATFLDRIRSSFAARPDLPILLVDDYFTEALKGAPSAWRRVVSTAAELGIPAPGFSSALNYYDSLRAERLPAALTQGQRDYFGPTPTAAPTARAATTPCGPSRTARSSRPVERRQDACRSAATDDGLEGRG